MKKIFKKLIPTLTLINAKGIDTNVNDSFISKINACQGNDLNQNNKSYVISHHKPIVKF